MSATARTGEKQRARERDRGRVLVIAGEAHAPGCVAALEAAGFSVFGAGGGAAAFVALQRTRPHVVVADTGLRGIGAGDFLRALSKPEDATPVVLVGGAPSAAGRRLQSLNEGAADYVQLPAETDLLLARVAQLVASRQQLDRLRAEADLDFLTGLANRRRFRKALNQEVERWRRYRMPCALLLLDIDHMKRINDTHGHPAGDAVLRSVAHVLADFSRDNDTAARLGGEEFALLLSGVDGARAAAAAERIRAGVASAQVEGVGRATVSVGVAACPDHAESERELFSASDAALYLAKQGGRNRVETATPQRA